jgi:hypothetical protein
MKQIWLKSAMMVAAVFCGAMSGFAKEWTYNESAKTMSDAEGKWTVNVTSIANLEQGELTIYKAVAPFNDETGTLDLRDIVFVKDGVPYSITSLKLDTRSLGESYATGVTNFYANHVVGTIPRKMFQSSKFLKEVKISGEGVTALGDNVFNGCSVLESVELDCPNMLTMGESAFTGCVNLAGDIQDVVPSSVTNVGSSAFRMDAAGENTGLTGTLVLTNLSVMGGVAFRKCKGLTGVDLRGPITSFSGNTFNGCSGIKTAVFDMPNLTSVDYNSSLGSGDFSGVSFSSVTFLGKALAQEVIDKLMGGVYAVAATTDKDKGCKMYVSRRQEGWTELAQSVDSTTKEAKYIPTSEGNNFMGVYVSTTEKTQPGRKAWMIHRASPHDSSAFVIRVR